MDLSTERRLDRLAEQRLAAAAVSVSVLGSEIVRLAAELDAARAASARWEEECRRTDAARAELVGDLTLARNQILELERVRRDLARAAETKPELVAVTPSQLWWWCAACSCNVTRGKPCALCKRNEDGTRASGKRRGRK